jgi:hypothetical protein
MNIRPAKDSFKADHFPSPSDFSPTIPQTRRRTQPAFPTAIEEKRERSALIQGSGIPVLYAHQWDPSADFAETYREPAKRAWL